LQQLYKSDHYSRSTRSWIASRHPLFNQSAFSRSCSWTRLFSNKRNSVILAVTGFYTGRLVPSHHAVMAGTVLWVDRGQPGDRLSHHLWRRWLNLSPGCHNDHNLGVCIGKPVGGWQHGSNLYYAITLAYKLTPNCWFSGKIDTWLAIFSSFVSEPVWSVSREWPTGSLAQVSKGARLGNFLVAPVCPTENVATGGPPLLNAGIRNRHRYCKRQSFCTKLELNHGPEIQYPVGYPLSNRFLSINNYKDWECDSNRLSYEWKSQKTHSSVIAHKTVFLISDKSKIVH